MDHPTVVPVNFDPDRHGGTDDRGSDGSEGPER